MNINILLTIFSLFVLIIFRLSHNDIYFYLNPGMYLILIFGLLFYILGKKYNLKKCLLIQFVITICILLVSFFN